MTTDADPGQLLIAGAEDALTMQLTAPDSAPIFSGCTGEHRERIRKLRTAVLEMTLAGIGVKRIAEAVSISPQAVRAVRASAWQTGELDPLKQRLGREYLATADLLRAAAVERIEEIPAHVLLLASAQAADKGQLLTGGATQRVERVAVASNLNDLIDALPVEVEAHEVGADLVARVGPAASGAQKESDRLGLPAPAVPGPVDAVDSLSTRSPGQTAPCVSACVTGGLAT